MKGRSRLARLEAGVVFVELRERERFPTGSSSCPSFSKQGRERGPVGGPLEAEGRSGKGRIGCGSDGVDLEERRILGVGENVVEVGEGGVVDALEAGVEADGFKEAVETGLEGGCCLALALPLVLFPARCELAVGVIGSRRGGEATRIGGRVKGGTVIVNRGVGGTVPGVGGGAPIPPGPAPITGGGAGAAFIASRMPSKDGAV